MALFGPAGPNDNDAAFASCKTSEIWPDLVEAGARTFGIVVLPDPPS